MSTHDSEDKTYAVVVATGATERTERSGLSHPAAMRLAEELESAGNTARVLHVLGAGRFEVDRYPLR
jgi:hypothetical protein